MLCSSRAEEWKCVPIRSSHPFGTDHGYALNILAGPCTGPCTVTTVSVSAHNVRTSRGELRSYVTEYQPSRVTFHWFVLHSQFLAAVSLRSGHPGVFSTPQVSSPPAIFPFLQCALGVPVSGAALHACHGTVNGHTEFTQCVPSPFLVMGKVGTRAITAAKHLGC
ncbi:hypothetical protein PAXRUDRAFT_749558 [Paxillus rubicundulus Ve08.2h10]|uniref:Uncharacterized protein n=1 Tax=Paxillus rubicundulus Ve08.2h10 TaxID=930991 RepID=A0A0D0DQH0_9AGAM|nr:hypothetical protein PAXRUDRAFT_749558 [Paxillus rubicundulus Ve08.2h10]